MKGQDSELTWPTGGNQLTEKRNGTHAEDAAQPDAADDLVGVADGLPGAGPQGMADGIVALTGYGHQSPRGDSHRGGWKREDVYKNSILSKGWTGCARC